MTDVLDRLEDLLWSDKDGTLSAAHSEISILREEVRRCDMQICHISEAAETYKSTVEEYFEVAFMYEIDQTRQRYARLADGGALEEACSKLIRSSSRSTLSSGAPLGASLRMAAMQIHSAAELLDGAICSMDAEPEDD